jgi:hypothetical protein
VILQDIRRRADHVRGVALEAVLLAAGAAPDRCDKAKWRTAQGVISVTGPKFMNWDRGVGGGGAIDLAMHLNHMGFKDAVEWLWRRFANFDVRQPPPSARRNLSLPPPDAAKLPLVKRYLIDERAIAPASIDSLVESGKLYADNFGNAVFLLKGEHDTLVGAELRGTRTSRRPWRGMAPGSQKDLGCFSVRAPLAADVEEIILCESAIDAISCLALHPRSLCISTAGARPSPRWLAPLIQQGRQVYCGFDADSTGETMAAAMIALHPAVKRLRPPRHDWNDVLTSPP